MKLLSILNWLLTVGGVAFLVLWGLKLGMPAISKLLLHLVSSFRPSRIILYLFVLTAFIVLLSFRLQSL